MLAEQLLGAWQLAEQVEQWDDGRRTFPRSEHVHGLIQYTAGGWMSAILGRVDLRPGRDPATLDYALEELLAYGGHFTADSQASAVQHQLTVCSYPPWTGTTLQRTAAFPQTGQLQLIGARPGGGAQRRLRWERPPEGLRMSDQTLAGAWLLEEYVAFGTDGAVQHPMGLQPYGLLHYGPDGWMSVIISRQDRQMTQLPGSDDFAFTEFVCYYGPYTVDAAASTVTHHTVYASYTPMHRTDLVRQLTFLEPDVITLTARNPAGQVITLRWRRQPAHG